jgi:hypothetical protein
MLQDALSVRFYQRITDALVDQWNRGYRTDELRLYLDGYLAAMRHADAVEPFQIHRIEEEAIRFLHDGSNFATPQPQPEPDYY